jgi:hypothetical protein
MSTQPQTIADVARMPLADMESATYESCDKLEALANAIHALLPDQPDWAPLIALGPGMDRDMTHRIQLRNAHASVRQMADLVGFFTTRIREEMDCQATELRGLLCIERGAA